MGKCSQYSKWEKKSTKLFIYRMILLLFLHMIIKKYSGDFPGGAVVRNPPANAGDTGSIPGPGRPHVPRSN